MNTTTIAQDRLAEALIGTTHRPKGSSHRSIAATSSHSTSLASIIGAVVRRRNGLERNSSRPILAGMAKKPEPPPKPITWTIYKIAAKQTWIGTIEAVDEATAIEKAAAEFRVPATKLHAVQRR